MQDMLSEGLIVPALLIGLLGFFTPRALSKVLPEGVLPLLINGFVSTGLCTILSGAFFYLQYLWQGMPLSQPSPSETAPLALHFLNLGLASALIWAPVMLLSLSGLPKRWVHETW
ncbi:hypothetical protein [Yoonia litorea]|uniref:Uncharacterized protein n=1 Tax=Yoonia litorea TaxID=1123755 RepID=A0A1I6N0W3_9RHOB|nr:hypothetical protein [Yoonia litorea]SFS21501.1 hypothetical protein SAMN05444714_2846 [Yoonia litorea]